MTGAPCCKPVSRVTPSGAKRFHQKTCPMYPGARVHPATPIRHKAPQYVSPVLTAQETQDRMDYLNYWADRAFEINGDR